MSTTRTGYTAIALSFMVTLMLTALPMPAWAALWRPAWVALVLIYWCMAAPRYTGVVMGWVLGLLLDVLAGTLLGQHALALCLVVYITVRFHLQMRQFPLSQLTATVFAQLALYQFILFWINGVAGVHTTAVTYWGPVLSGTIIWPFLFMFFSGMRYRATAKS